MTGHRDHATADASTIVITGASSGIGLALATHLAPVGHRLALVCRDPARGEAAVGRVRAAGGDARLFVADLARMAEVRRVAAEIAAACGTVDVLVNNAALQRTDRHVTPDGIEMTLAVNVLAPLLLVRELEPALRRGTAPHVVNISSLVHKWGRIAWDDLDSSQDYDSDRAYYQSKLAILTLSLELARRLAPSVRVNAVHPGQVRTDFGRDFRGFRGGMARLWRAFMVSPEESARHIARVALSDEYATTTGSYFVKGRPARYAEDRVGSPADQARLLGLCEERIAAALAGASRVGRA